jgi:outer membrane protein assembly factor BamB
MSSMTAARILTLAIISLTLAASAEDWPRWRGARMDDVSPETQLLKSWPAAGPTRLWLNEDAGLGYSGVAISAGTLYTMGARDAVEYVIAIDTATGKEKWSTEAGPLLINNWGGGPRSTPTVDGDKVYALAGKGNVVCIHAADGKRLWNTELTSLGGEVPKWGYTESLLIDGKHVIATPGGAKGTMVALDKLTGSLVWQTAAWTDAAHYSSPISCDHNGAHQIVQLTAQSVAGVNASDGKVLWTAPFPGKVAVIPTPIFHAGKVFVAAGYQVGCKLLDLTADGAKELYANTHMANHHGGVILHGSHLYGYSDGQGWTCMDYATGAVKWQEKKALKKGAIAAAGEQLYLLEEDTGTVVLIDASPTGYQEHGRFTLSPQTTLRAQKGKIWMHPVISNGKLYLRDQELLFCYDISSSK